MQATVPVRVVYRRGMRGMPARYRHKHFKIWKRYFPISLYHLPNSKRFSQLSSSSIDDKTDLEMTWKIGEKFREREISYFSPLLVASFSFLVLFFPTILLTPTITPSLKNLLWKMFRKVFLLHNLPKKNIAWLISRGDLHFSHSNTIFLHRPHFPFADFEHLFSDFGAFPYFLR